MVGEQKESPVATHQNQTRIRPPNTTASFVYQTPMSVSYRIPPHRFANWPMHCALVMQVRVYPPYGMYQYIFYRNIVVSTHWRDAPGCLLSAAALPGTAVCSIYQFSIAPIRGCLAKPCIKSLFFITLRHRCAQKIQYLKTRSHPVPSHA